MEVRQTVSPTYTSAFCERVATAYKTAPGAALVVTPELHLIKDAGFEPTPSMTAVDLAAVEADFTDYAAEALVLSAPVNLGPSVEGVSATATFDMPTSPTVVENTVFGYWIEEATIVVCAEMFAAGQEVGMAAPGDQLVMVGCLPIQCFQSVEGVV